MVKGDNKGLTLVELLIAMVITVIIAGAIIAFMNSGTQSYNFARNQLNTQIEAQTLINLISDRIMEGNNVAYDAAGNRLVIYYVNGRVTPAIVEKKVSIRWVPAQKKLYLKDEMTLASEELFGEYVSGFSCTPGEDSLKIMLELKYNDDSYKIEDEVKLRNTVTSLPDSEPILVPGALKGGK